MELDCPAYCGALGILMNTWIGWFFGHAIPGPHDPFWVWVLVIQWHISLPKCFILNSYELSLEAVFSMRYGLSCHSLGFFLLIHELTSVKKKYFVAQRRRPELRVPQDSQRDVM